jgi:hypothetical protein
MSDFSIEYLLRTNDHAPHLVGKLEFVPPGDVTIEVWRCSAEGVETVPLATSGCYPIGDTGRWGWSTVHLDTAAASDRRTYFYRMSAPNGKTFDGSFLVNGTAGMPGSMRRSRRREK